MQHIVLYILFLICLAIREELVNSRAEVKSFDKSKLQHVETQEKNSLPDAKCKYSDAYFHRITIVPFVQ